MTFQPHPLLRAAPGSTLGAVVSFCLMLATFAGMIALAASGIGLVEW
jgi:hypothetical protein